MANEAVVPQGRVHMLSAGQMITAQALKHEADIIVGGRLPSPAGSLSTRYSPTLMTDPAPVGSPETLMGWTSKSALKKSAAHWRSSVSRNLGEVTLRPALGKGTLMALAAARKLDPG